MSSSNPISIPARRSSKRALEIQIEDLDYYKLDKLDVNLSDKIAGSRKRLKSTQKSSGSFDAVYWEARASIAADAANLTAVKRQKSIAHFIKTSKLNAEEAKQEYSNTEEAHRFRNRENAQIIDQKLCHKTSQALKNPDGYLRRSFVNLYAQSKLGLGIAKIAAGDRDGSLQSNFRAQLIDLSCQESPEIKGIFWCPIISRYEIGESMTAAHLFPWKSGADAMSAIFGEEVNGELFSPKNGIFISSKAEKRLDEGSLVLVPAIDDATSAEQRNAWNELEVKEYKLRVVHPNGPGMDSAIHADNTMTWKDLDNKPVTFKNNLRPRARYLYYVYCCAMMRRAINVEKREDACRDTLGRKYWGTAGRYMKRSMIRGFIETLGSEFEDLLEGAQSDDGAKPDYTAVASANAHVLRRFEEEDEDTMTVFSTQLEDDEEADDDEDDDEEVSF